MPIPPQDYIFIADESGISNDRFTVVGGLCMHRDSYQRAYDALEAFSENHNMKAELKWSKVSNQKLSEYKALVDCFFDLNNTDHLHFHCLCFDSHQWNHKKYNNGDSDIGLSKLYYQLILHKFVKTHGHKGSLYVRVDHRNSSTPLETIRSMLNATAARDHGIATRPVKQFVSEDSKKCRLLQLNDVILGAVCAARNSRHLLEGGREAKKELAKLVLEKSGLDGFERNSPMSVKRFTIWNMNASPR